MNWSSAFNGIRAWYAVHTYMGTIKRLPVPYKGLAQDQWPRVRDCKSPLMKSALNELRERCKAQVRANLAQGKLPGIQPYHDGFQKNSAALFAAVDGQIERALKEMPYGRVPPDCDLFKFKVVEYRKAIDWDDTSPAQELIVKTFKQLNTRYSAQAVRSFLNYYHHYRDQVLPNINATLVETIYQLVKQSQDDFAQTGYHSFNSSHPEYAVFLNIVDAYEAALRELPIEQNPHIMAIEAAYTRGSF